MPVFRILIVRLSIPLFAMLLACAAYAQEWPYFITYTHNMEEAGRLEIEIEPVVGVPKGGARHFVSSAVELEYGVKGWWTSELYLDGEKTSPDNTAITGYRLENRF